MDKIRQFGENVLELLSSIITGLNPTDVAWTNAGEVAVFITKVIIFVAAIALLVYIIVKLPTTIRFIKESYRELRNVEWLSKVQTYRYSLVTLTVIILFSLLTLLADQAFLGLRNLLILRGA
jgi:preprotein translocase SecE subunit